MNKVSKKITFLVVSPIHVRNYIESGALEALSVEHECRFLVLNKIELPEQFEEKHRVERLADMPYRNHYLLFEFLMFKKRAVSSTFQFRIRRLYFPKLAHEKSTFWEVFRHLLRRVKLLLTWGLFWVSTFPIVNSIVAAFLKLSLERSKELEYKISQHRPDLIIMPSSAYEPINMEMVRIAKKLNSKTMMIIDNWDNLSSKSVMYNIPDLLSVWGQQSIEHSISIHGLLAQNIFTLGTPRFDSYFAARELSLPSPFDFRYILFVGTALEFNEKQALIALDRCISETAALTGLRVIYRPHPWRQSNLIIEVDELDNIQLDPQVSDSFQKGDKSQQPDLSYYPSLLQNAEAVVGGMTTMLIEAMLVRTPYLALIWNDPEYITNMNDVFTNYMHFRGIESLSALLFSKCSEDLPIRLSELCKLKKTINIKQLDDQLNYFYDLQNDKFSKRLNAIILKTL